MGTLKVLGKLDLGQFWPNGGADADTTTLQFTIYADAFWFAANGTDFLPTNAFDNASTNRQDIDGQTTQGKKSSNYVVKTYASKPSRITVRLQGIDAPELHYIAKITDQAVAPFAGTAAQKTMASKTLDKDYRQYRAETATVQLWRELSLNGKHSSLECEFISHNIEAPDDVIDKYHRFVGEIEVKYPNGRRKNINRWLLKNGWVFPAFYNSMLNQEIADFVALWNEGKAKPQSVQRFYKTQMSNFDFDLLYNKKTATNQPVYAPFKDRGLVILPKLFRRYIHYAIMQRAGLGVPATFQSYLQQYNNRDGFFLRSEFLANPQTAPKRLLSAHLPNDVFNVNPEDLILEEAESGKLYKNGVLVRNF
jgi:endonuclease YncB( thermonuclease family)